MFYKCRLVKIPQFSGDWGSVYTIIIDEDDTSAFENFVIAHKNLFKSEIKEILVRLKTMGHKTGMGENFFKLNEGKPGDGVCALYDKAKSNLRLYCIRYGSQLIIVGGGGHKPKSIRAFQDDKNLEKQNFLLRELSKCLTQKMKDKEIWFSNDGLDFDGDLSIENLNYE